MQKVIKYFLVTLCLSTISNLTFSQDHRYDPPWNTPPESSVMFTIPGIDNVPDLYGDINDPQLVVFFAGNQFMVIDDLMKAFKKAYPQYQRVFAETLPPGKLADQIKGGSLTIGNMRITLKPDVYTAGKNRIVEMGDYFDRTEVYTYNKLAIMVAEGNPLKIKGLSDLGRKGLKVSMPNPLWEGIGKRIEEAYVKAGGEKLKKTIMEDKVKDGSTFLTHIHHRQSPMRMLYKQSEAAPVWYSEVHFQKMMGHPIGFVEVVEKENIKSTYMAGKLKDAPHQEAAQDFMDFLISKTAKDIYKKYGFSDFK
ncbi:MAG TPA: substrate-binding domain-containing protein [Flavisolibacter sp.]|nr:substrate-binding domain-containing protein [Flavisolibacter sp.]